MLRLMTWINDLAVKTSPDNPTVRHLRALFSKATGRVIVGIVAGLAIGSLSAIGTVTGGTETRTRLVLGTETRTRLVLGVHDAIRRTETVRVPRFLPPFPSRPRFLPDQEDGNRPRPRLFAVSLRVPVSFPSAEDMRASFGVIRNSRP
jgi:hypothetical protein